MLYHGSQAGALSLKMIVLESITSMRRAGRDPESDIINRKRRTGEWNLES